MFLELSLQEQGQAQEAMKEQLSLGRCLDNCTVTWKELYHTLPALLAGQRCDVTWVTSSVQEQGEAGGDEGAGGETEGGCRRHGGTRPLRPLLLPGVEATNSGRQNRCSPAGTLPTNPAPPFRLKP